jgi:menaquinone-specific isochorismate synthase
MSDLVARTRRLDVDVDLLDVAGAGGLLFERARSGFAGRGEALRLELIASDPANAREAARALAAIPVDDEVGAPGCGAVAFGAVPFAPGSAGALVVPELTVGRSEDGTRWVTVVGPAGAEQPPLLAPVTDRRQPGSFEVRSSRPAEWWCGLVEGATKAMASGALDKVVLAREVVVTADLPIDGAAVLGRLRAADPGCMVLSIDGLVGASPELLVSRQGDVVRAHPMAGTAPRGGDPSADARLAAGLLASTKDREEHQITIDMVHDTLLPWCSYLDYEAEPSIVAVANVQHLATLVEGRLSQPAPSVLELVAALHPTPAVAGWPRDMAVDFIAEHEQLDRRRYAGAIGWVDGRGNGAWAVGIRCAELDGPVARVFAGNGIVPDSDPRTELAETQAKLQALLSAIVRP